MALLKRKRAGLADAMDVVTRFVNACNRHDAEGVYACLHPDFDSIQPMYPARNFRGADQVRRNWQAIFDAEPGFRLTVLRSASTDDTVWLELHGAGEDAEVAGIFVMGIAGDRIRWARIYSALVEPVPAGVGEPPAPGLRQVPPAAETATADGGDVVVEEALIAPVLDMERSTRRRRRRHAAEQEAQADAAAATGEPAPTAVGPSPEEQQSLVDEVAVAADGLEDKADDLKADVDAVSEGPPEVEVVEVVAAEPDVDGVEAGAAEPEVEAVDIVEVVEAVEVLEVPAEVEDPAEVEVPSDEAEATEAEAEPEATAAEAEPEATAAEPTEVEAVVVVDTVVVEAPLPSDEDDLDTQAVPLIVWDDDPADGAGIFDRPDTEETPEGAPADPAGFAPPKRRFGKRPRS